MAGTETNWIDFFISLAPIAQTGIWAGVAVAVLFVLRKPLQKLGDELIRRVNQGDTVTTPWLSLESREERERVIVQQVTESIRREIKAPDALNGTSLSVAEDAKIDALLNEVGSRFVDLIFPASEFETTHHEDKKTSLYVTAWPVVSDFLNEIYFAAIDSGVELPIWTYGKYWHLKNKRTGKYIEKSRKGPKLDMRPFEDLGIVPGDVLIAERIR